MFRHSKGCFQNLSKHSNFSKRTLVLQPPPPTPTLPHPPFLAPTQRIDNDHGSLTTDSVSRLKVGMNNNSSTASMEDCSSFNSRSSTTVSAAVSCWASNGHRVQWNGENIRKARNTTSQATNLHQCTYYVGKYILQQKLKNKGKQG